MANAPNNAGCDIPDIEIGGLKNGSGANQPRASREDKHAKSALELFNIIQDELNQREEDLKDGLSFLDMKNDTLLSYMIDVCNIVLRKARGESISGHPSVERCVEYRIILEKIRSIDQKLSYQLNKLITLPEEEDQRIDVKNLDIDLEGIGSDVEKSNESGSDIESDHQSDEEDREESDDNATGEEDDVEDEEDELEEDERNVQVHKPQKPADKAKTPIGVYKPPKLRSVAYTEEADLRGGDRGRRRNYDDFYQDDEGGEIFEGSRSSRKDAKTRFEEDNYTRLPDDNPRKAKRKMKTKEHKKKGKNKFKRRKK